MPLRRGERAIFIRGFARGRQENIRRDELKAVRRLADEMLSPSGTDLAVAEANGTIVEVKCDEQAIRE